jgi:RNA polymerase sigma-70 factor, ECF subfamily
LPPGPDFPARSYPPGLTLTASSMDPSAFGRLALPHMDALFGTARRLTRSDADAKDLLQQTYLEAFRSVRTLSEPERIRPWMFRILRNVWADETRRRYDRPPLELLDPSVRSGNLEEEVLRAGFCDEVTDALAALPADFRWAVVLVDIEGLSYDEAAVAMDCPKGTVRSRLARGREALIARLARERAVAACQGGQR